LKVGRLFLQATLVALCVIGVWQVADEERRAIFQAYDARTTQVRDQQTQAEALCRKFSTVKPLTLPLDGKAIALESAPGAREVAGYVRQALPGARVFVQGVLEEQLGYDLPTVVRGNPPADAVVLRASERKLPDEEAAGVSRGIGHLLELTIVDHLGNQLGYWQGFPGGTCSSARNLVPLQAFLASKGAGAVVLPSSYRKWQDLKVDVFAAKAKRTARPEDFSTPISNPRCQATLVTQQQARDPALQVATASGNVTFRDVKPDRTLPAVACGEDRVAVLFRTDTQVVVAVLSSDGYVLALGRVPMSKAPGREAFRDVAIKGGMLNATLVAFDVDKGGVLSAEEGRNIVISLGAAPEAPRQETALARAEARRFATCSAPPDVPRTVEVHELGSVGGSWEYVQTPGQPPMAFRNIVIDAPLRNVAVSFPEVRIELVWLFTTTSGTDLRYVEISGTQPQTVLFSNPTNAVINVVTDPSCKALFARRSSSRAEYQIRQAFEKRGQREVINPVLLANGSPLITSQYTYQAVESFGMKHISSLHSYLLQLKSEGAIQDATQEDLRRIRQLYYSSMPLWRKAASWFRQDPALEIRSRRPGPGGDSTYMIKGKVLLPKYPLGTMEDSLLIIDKGVEISVADLKEYVVIDANTLSCPAQQRGCPWSEQTQSR